MFSPYDYTRMVATSGKPIAVPADNVSKSRTLHYSYMVSAMPFRSERPTARIMLLLFLVVPLLSACSEDAPSGANDPPPGDQELDFRAIAGEWTGKLTAYDGDCTFHSEIAIDSTAAKDSTAGTFAAWYCDAPSSDSPYCDSNWNAREIGPEVNGQPSFYSFIEQALSGDCPRGTAIVTPNAGLDTLDVKIESNETDAIGFVVRSE